MNFNAGDVLGSDGADGQFIYLIAQGQVDVLRSTTSSAASDEADADDDIADALPCELLPARSLWSALSTVFSSQYCCFRDTASIW